MALIIDVETTGLPDYKGLSYGSYPDYKNIDKYASARIVEISMILCDKNFKQIEAKTIIVKAVGFTINNSQFHGITNKISATNGVYFREAVIQLDVYLSQVSHLVAHNIAFDINVIKSELYRGGFTNTITQIETKKLFCTMKHTKNIVKARGKYGIKDPSLSELYKFVFNKEIQNAHRAEYDTRNLYDIIQQLYESGRLTGISDIVYFPSEQKLTCGEDNTQKDTKYVLESTKLCNNYEDEYYSEAEADFEMMEYVNPSSDNYAKDINEYIDKYY